MMTREGRRLAAWVAAAAVVGMMLAAGPVRAADSVTLTAEINLPQMVGIRVRPNSIRLRPGGDYPPETFPYWVASRSFRIEVFATTAFKVTVSATGWPSGSGLTVGDLYIAAWKTGPGPSMPPHGSDDPGSGWEQVGDNDHPATVIGPRPMSLVWDPYEGKLLLRLTGDEPESDTAYSTMLICTISAVL